MSTFGWLTGYEKRLILPKSSPVARMLPDGARLTVLTSVPSLPSGQIPAEQTWNGNYRYRRLKTTNYYWNECHRTLHEIQANTKVWVTNVFSPTISHTFLPLHE